MSKRFNFLNKHSASLFLNIAVLDNLNIHLSQMITSFSDFYIPSCHILNLNRFNDQIHVHSYTFFVAYFHPENRRLKLDCLTISGSLIYNLLNQRTYTCLNDALVKNGYFSTELKNFKLSPYCEFFEITIIVSKNLLNTYHYFHPQSLLCHRDYSFFHEVYYRFPTTCRSRLC